MTPLRRRAARGSEAVEYLVVDGQAVIAHGYPRLIKDMDLLVRTRGSNRTAGLLERAALATGGEFRPPMNALFDPAGQAGTYDEPLWQRGILLSLVIFHLDLLLRRVRIFDRHFEKGPRRLAGASREKR